MFAVEARPTWQASKVRAATLSDLVNEKASFSPVMSMRIELAFEVKADLFLRMQALYDAMIFANLHRRPRTSPVGTASSSQ